MNKTFTIFSIFIFAAFFIYGLTKQISESIKVGERLETAANEVNTLQDQNRKLKNQLSSVQKPEYVEQIARNKLNLAKSNETVVIISDEAINQAKQAENPVITPVIVSPNWQKWLNLFTQT